MLGHAWHLALRSWGAMVSATGTSTLGFIIWTVALSLVGWLFSTIDKWLTLRKSVGAGAAASQSVRFTSRSGLMGMATISSLAAITWAVFIVRTIYQDHLELARANSSDLVRVRQLEKDLEVRRHSVSSTDPVFANAINRMQAFAMFRAALHGESCEITITAPPGSSASLAQMIPGLSVPVSNCLTPLVGEDAVGKSDLKTVIFSGMVPGAIVFHAVESDKAAMTLFDQLGNQMRVVRSYEVPARFHYAGLPDGYAHTICCNSDPRLSGIARNGEPAGGTACCSARKSR